MTHPSQTKRRFVQGCAAASAGILLGFSGSVRSDPSSLHVSIRRAPVKPGSAEELARRVPIEVLPLLRALPGFVSFQMVDGDNDMVTAIALYTSEAAAREANDKVVPMVRDVFAPLLAGPVEPSTGTLIVNAKRE